MPLFLRHKLALVHIPKTGGTAIAAAMRRAGDPPVFADESFTPQNGLGLKHSPQHSSYEELTRWGLIPRDFTVVAVARDPYRRFVSEYNWRKWHGYPKGQREFASHFFDGASFWDQHERPQSFFVRGGESRIHILRQENLSEGFFALTGVRLGSENASAGSTDILPENAALVASLWAEDFDRFGYPR